MHAHKSMHAHVHLSIIMFAANCVILHMSHSHMLNHVNESLCVLVAEAARQSGTEGEEVRLFLWPVCLCNDRSVEYAPLWQPSPAIIKGLL